MAKDGLAVPRHIGWDRDVHIVGVSMGGMITQELALPDIECFASVTLLSTIAGGVASIFEFVKVIPSGILNLLQSLVAQTPHDKAEKLLKLLFPSTYLEALDKATGTTNAEIVRGVMMGRAAASAREGRKDMGFSIFVKQALAFLTHRVTADKLKDLGRVFPVLVVTGDSDIVVPGDSDILVPSSNSEFLAREGGHGLVLSPGAGHGASEQCADQTNPFIRNLIERRVISKL